ncbi:hypothetical protein ND16A_1864 [Thalassotalea sp. ND16A]|nr:hypothetical protein ND16A_1864 [Thalassotalea sp. ND16A]
MKNNWHNHYQKYYQDIDELSFSGGLVSPTTKHFLPGFDYLSIKIKDSVLKQLIKEQRLNLEDFHCNNKVDKECLRRMLLECLVS